MKNTSKIYFSSNKPPETWGIYFKFLIKVYKWSFFLKNIFSL